MGETLWILERMKRIHSYYVRDKKFNQLFPQYHLCKIGYTTNLKGRIQQFPNVDDLELVELRTFKSIDDAWEGEQEWMQSQRVHFHPFWNKERLNTKAIPYMSSDMVGYFKSMMVRELTSNWGSTEWFVIKVEECTIK